MIVVLYKLSSYSNIALHTLLLRIHDRSWKMCGVLELNSSEKSELPFYLLIQLLGCPALLANCLVSKWAN